MSDQKNLSAPVTARSETTFSLQRIYVKDVSFESPQAPESFLRNWKPKVHLELNSKYRILGDDLYEVLLIMKVTATNADDGKTVYICEVQQGGICAIASMDDATLVHTLEAFCPGLLFPYAREALDALVIKGSFSPLMLAPVNFDAIFEHNQARKKATTH